MLRDLWLGAGWGLIDSLGRPKSAYYAVARASAPRAVSIIDEGLNGLAIHVANDRPLPLAGRLELTLFDVTGLPLAETSLPVSIEPHSVVGHSADRILGAFRDLSYSYRFGPPTYDALRVRLSGEDGELISTAHHLPAGHRRAVEGELGLTASMEVKGDQCVVRVTAERFAHFVSFHTPGWVPQDDWFHLAPGEVRHVTCRPLGAAPASGWSVQALNARSAMPVASVAGARNRGSG